MELQPQVFISLCLLLKDHLVSKYCLSLNPNTSGIQKKSIMCKVSYFLTTGQFNPNMAEDSVLGRKMIDRWQWMYHLTFAILENTCVVVLISQWITKGLIAHGNGSHYKIKTMYLFSSRRESHI